MSTITFPRSRVDQFRHNDPTLRWGQAFHQYMKLHKCKTDKMFCDRLYNASDELAKKLVHERIDESN